MPEFPAWLQQFLGSGAAVAVAGWWGSRKLEQFKHGLAETLTKRKLRTDYIRDQIEKLYGPLAFFIESSARHIDMSRKIDAGYREYFESRRQLDGAAANEAVQEADKVLDTANRYVQLVVENNKETVKV